jgi:molybdopterin-containing oxidoreductase family iron-sulfur binding subunit
VAVCPVGATKQRADGIVTVDYDACIGCGACVEACPYDARTILPELVPYYDDLGEPTPFEQAKPQNLRAGVAQKCVFCKDLVDQGEVPACVKTCPCYARFFGDLDDPNSEVSRLIQSRKGATLLPQQGTDPRVYYLPSKVRL